MRPRGWLAALGALAIASGINTAVSTHVGSSAVDVTSLTLSVPGTFAGCNSLDPSTSPPLRALYDLIRPSAFVTRSNGTLIGASGPIEQAELVSLTPQTVIYTLSTQYHWSNGQPFDGRDLVQWYEQARRQPTSLSDGYRSIATVTLSPTYDKVTVVFARPYADWPMLFRDVTERGTPTGCALGDVLAQATLGPYRLTALSATSAQLRTDPTWNGPTPHFTYVRIQTSPPTVRDANSAYVAYGYAENLDQLRRSSNDLGMNGRFSSSNGLVVLGFSPHRPTSTKLAVRQYLGLVIDRQLLINQVVGPVTYDAGLASSVIYPQGTLGHLGTVGLSPFDQSSVAPSTTMPSSAGEDCTSCAAPILLAAGFTHSGGLWRSSSGAPLRVQLVVGPTTYDRSSARVIAAMWRAGGVLVKSADAATDQKVAAALRDGASDAGVMTVDTSIAPGFTSRAWTGTDYGDGFDTGWRSVLIDQWYAAATTTFNPNNAAPSYESIDQYVTTQGWQRPLFTQPSVLTWSVELDGIDPSNYLDGIVDQVPTWGYVPGGAP